MEGGLQQWGKAVIWDMLLYQWSGERRARSCGFGSVSVIYCKTRLSRGGRLDLARPCCV